MGSEVILDFILLFLSVILPYMEFRQFRRAAFRCVNSYRLFVYTDPLAREEISYVAILVFWGDLTFPVNSTPHVPQHSVGSHTDFLFAIFCFWLAKHVRLLKCLLNKSQGTRTSEIAHGELVMQSLHVCSQRCVISLLQLWLHTLLTYIFTIALVTFVIT